MAVKFLKSIFLKNFLPFWVTHRMPALGRWWMSLSANSLRVRATVIVSLLLQEPYHCQQDKTYKTNGQLRNDQAYPCNKQYQALVGTRVADIEADHGTTDCNHPEYRGHHSQYQWDGGDVIHHEYWAVNKDIRNNKGCDGEFDGGHPTLKGVGPGNPSTGIGC